MKTDKYVLVEQSCSGVSKPACWHENEELRQRLNKMRPYVKVEKQIDRMSLGELRAAREMLALDNWAAYNYPVVRLKNGNPCQVGMGYAEEQICFVRKSPGCFYGMADTKELRKLPDSPGNTRISETFKYEMLRRMMWVKASGEQAPYREKVLVTGGCTDEERMMEYYREAAGIIEKWGAEEHVLQLSTSGPTGEIELKVVNIEMLEPKSPARSHLTLCGITGICNGFGPGESDF